jgi:DNA-binding IclR family transcriptional regulator
MTPAVSTQKSFQVLRILAATGAQGATLGEISAAAGLPKPTTHRLLAAMVQQGFALRGPKGRRYLVGPEIYALALKSQSTVSLVERWRGSLLRIAERTGDSSFLMVRSGNDAVCMGMHEVLVHVRTLTGGPGGRIPLGVGPGSIAILSTMNDDEVSTILGSNERRLRVLDEGLPELAPDLVARVRTNGYAVSVGATILPEVAGIAVPIPRELGVPECALSIATLVTRVTPERTALVVDAIRDEVQRVSPVAA